MQLKYHTLKKTSMEPIITDALRARVNRISARETTLFDWTSLVNEAMCGHMEVSTHEKQSNKSKT